jgi:hypothetical protein
VRSISKSGKQSKISKLKRLNDWYEANQTTFDEKEGCNGKPNRYNSRKICELLPVNETVETPVTSACLSVASLDFKTDHMKNKPLHIK